MTMESVIKGVLLVHSGVLGFLSAMVLLMWCKLMRRKP